jgi:hypothetical protein
MLELIAFYLCFGAGYTLLTIIFGWGKLNEVADEYPQMSIPTLRYIAITLFVVVATIMGTALWPVFMWNRIVDPDGGL